MSRALRLGLVLVLAAGCALPPERVAVKPLPEDGAPVAFGELASRARLQASAATEAFYSNKWADLEEAARALEQTGRFLLKATEVPAGHKDSLATEADELKKAANSLREAAKAQDVKQTNESLQQINLKVRELRLNN